jgi:tetratricopeptide (TPR) repeat protein
MRTRLGSIGIGIALVALAAGVVLAAGSSEKPAAEEKTVPGVAEYNKGVGLMKRGSFAEAQKQFEAALAQNERWAEAHNNLGYSLRKQGTEHYAAALEHYDRAIELDPKLAEAYMYRGVLHMLMGHEDLALADHAKLVPLKRKMAEELQAAIASKEEPEGLKGLSSTW